MPADPVPPNGMVSTNRCTFTRFTPPPPKDSWPTKRSMVFWSQLKMKAASGRPVFAIRIIASSACHEHCKKADHEVRRVGQMQSHVHAGSHTDRLQTLCCF